MPMIPLGNTAHCAADLPTPLVEQTLTQFGQDEESGPVRAVLRGEERRFAGLLTRGRKVLAQLGPGRPTKADLRYLHQTHGLPPGTGNRAPGLAHAATSPSADNIADTLAAGIS